MVSITCYIPFLTKACCEHVEKAPEEVNLGRLLFFLLVSINSISQQ